MTDADAIRWAAEADVPTLARLFAEEERENARFASAAFEETPFETLIERLRDGLFGPSATTRALAAFDASGTAAGVAYVARLWPGFRARPGWFLKQFFLTEAARGRGLGGRMIDRLIADAAADGADRLELHLIDDNVDARRFYERHGIAVKTDRSVARIELNRSGG